jgi:uncharacterized integral membrane protein (TIGR00698 family)
MPKHALICSDSAEVAAENNRTVKGRQYGGTRLGGWLLVTGASACLWWTLSPGIALLGGILIALVLGDQRVGDYGARSAQLLLKISVVGLGAGMNLGAVWRVGAQTAGYTAISIVLTLALGRWLGRRVHLPRDVALLVAVGTAICGGSAIAAVAGVIKPKREDITVALTSVFLLNALALLIFPGIGHALGFSPRQFGLWAALAIHDTSSVVGAAMTYGREAVSVATTAKLTRALWIVPVALAIGYRRRVPGEERVSLRRLPVPLFILGFLATAALFTYWAPLASWRLSVAAGAQRLFAVTLFLIGSGFSRAALRGVGIRPLVIGVALWFAVGTATAGALMGGWIH